MFYIKKRPFNKWSIPSFDYKGDGKYADKVIVAFDAEYQSGVTKPINIGGKNVDVNQRRLKDIISIQLAINYENREPIQVFIHRDEDEPAFIFNNLMQQVINYLRKIGVYSDIRKNIPRFKLEIWTFWGGVDLSVFKDWEKILTEYNDSKEKGNTSKLVAIHGNTVFTAKPLNLIIKNRQRHVINYFDNMRLITRDMTKLAPGKSNLEKLGELVHVPKLNTELWDIEDKKQQGFYKSHMMALWKHRRDDFIDYAMRDAVITALYGSFMLDFQNNLKKENLGDFAAVELKPSLGSIVSNVVAVRNENKADWIVERVLEQMKEMNGTSKDITSYLKGICLVTYKKVKNQSKRVPDFGFDELFNGPSTIQKLRSWLKEHLDFDLIRKGYKFPRGDISNDEYHKHLVHDITNRIDAPLATLFNDGTNAYYGGYNVTHVTGIIPDGGRKQDYDLKSAYNTAGHLIPDIAPALGITGHMITNIPANEFKKIVAATDKMNGPYTVGVGVFTINYPASYRGFYITPKSVNDGPRYFKNQEEVTLSYTDAYTAWMCGASVFTHRISFPYQSKMDSEHMVNICNEGIVQDIFQRRRAMYPDKHDPLNIMNKNVGNQVYGVTGEGLKEKHSRDFNDGRGYYIPFSRITNPLKAMQYTAITRLHIILLQKAILTVDPKTVFLNNVTDGCLVWTKHKLNTNKIMSAMNGLVDFRYKDAVMAHFKGQYFEEKDGTNYEVANLRTRLSFSRDDSLKAMVGISQSVLKPNEVFKKYLDNGAITIPVENRMITGIVDMRHTKKFSHLQTNWIEPVDLILGYDFSQWPVQYQKFDRTVYWITVPYFNEKDFQNLQPFGRVLMNYAPWYSSEYAPYFKKTLDELFQGLKPKFFGEFVRKKKGEKVPRKANEVYVNWSRYVVKYGLDLKSSYDRIKSLIDEQEWSFIRGNEESAIPTFGAFKTYVSRHGKQDIGMINYVLLHKIELI